MTNTFKKTFKAAFVLTLPIMAGYVFIGLAFGFLMKTKGFPAWYPIVMSLLICSGSLQFAAVPLLAAPFNPLGAFILGLLSSARHLFYGIPMLKKYKNTGIWKYPLIYTLTDETFSVLSTVEPTGNPTTFYVIFSLLNYFYWNIGTALGALVGSLITFDATGIDFALVALFIVLFIEQLKTRSGKISAFIGLIATVIIMAIFGGENLILLSMVLIAVMLLGSRQFIEKADANKAGGDENE